MFGFVWRVVVTGSHLFSYHCSTRKKSRVFGIRRFVYFGPLNSPMNSKPSGHPRFSDKSICTTKFGLFLRTESRILLKMVKTITYFISVIRPFSLFFSFPSLSKDHHKLFPDRSGRRRGMHKFFFLFFSP